MLSRTGVASRACPRHSASINPVSAPCRVHNKYAANEGDAAEQKLEPFNKVLAHRARCRRKRSRGSASCWRWSRRYLARPQHAAQVALGPRDLGAVHRHVGAGTHPDANIGPRKGGASLIPSPAIRQTGIVHAQHEGNQARALPGTGTCRPCRRVGDAILLYRLHRGLCGSCTFTRSTVLMRHVDHVDLQTYAYPSAAMSRTSDSVYVHGSMTASEPVNGGF